MKRIPIKCADEIDAIQEDIACLASRSRAIARRLADLLLKHDFDHLAGTVLSSACSESRAYRAAVASFVGIVGFTEVEDEQRQANPAGAAG